MVPIFVVLEYRFKKFLLKITRNVRNYKNLVTKKKKKTLANAKLNGLIVNFMVK